MDTPEQIRYQIAQLAASIPSDAAFEEYIKAWIDLQRANRNQAITQLTQLQQQLK